MLFAAMDLPSGIHKLGIKHMNLFQEQLKSDKSLKDILQQKRAINLTDSNDFLMKNSAKIGLQDASKMIHKGCITSR